MKKSKLLIFLLAAVSSVSLMTAATFAAGCAGDTQDPSQIEQPGDDDQTPDGGDEGGDDQTPGGDDQTPGGGEEETPGGGEEETPGGGEGEEGEGGDEATTYTVTFNSNGGSAVASATVNEGGKVTKPADPTNTNGENIVFGGWYSDALLTTPFDFENATITANTTLYAKWQQNVTTSVDFTSLLSLGTLGENYTYQGIFTFPSGMRFDAGNSSRGDSINTQTRDVTIVLTGTSNTITYYGQGASGGGATVSMSLKDSNGETIENSTTEAVGSGVNFTKKTISGLPKGTYTLVSTGGSIRITELSVTQLLDLGTPTGVVAEGISAPNTDILIGQQYDPSGVTAQIQYDNGTMQTKSIDPEDIDTTEVNVNAAGVYNVPFTYTENGQTVKGSYQVKVYAIDSITIGDYIQNKEVTTNLKKVYLDDEALSVVGLTVIATAKTGTGEGALEEDFVLPTSYYTVEKNTEGTSCDIAVKGDYLLDSAKPATDAYTIYGIKSEDVIKAIENGVLNVTVDSNATVSATSYKSLTDALCAINGAEVPDYVIKQITIADGEYKEKVYVDVPNVHLKAQNVVELADLGAGDSKNSKVVFWYDALSGTSDPAGNSHGTNGSASFTVASSATGFRAEGITFKNYYNTNELYQYSKEKITSNTQAVAMYIDAEQVAFYNCKFTSYHDTLYANKGSHYFEDCWIEGRTDYIFGSTATSYYKDCQIWSIGAGVTEENGGYVCAVQNDGTGVFVFDGCNFDGDENVKDGSIALGRPWAVGMKMVVMNSTISGKFSTDEHTEGIDQGQRYVIMSGNEPNPANYIEYNNKGAGALIAGTAPTEGEVVGKYLDEAQIAAYATTTCTLVTDASAVAQYQLDALFTDWDPTVKDLVTVTVKSNNGDTTYGSVALFKGATPSTAVLGSLIPDEAVPEGYMVEGYASMPDADEADVTVGAIESDTIYYLVIKEIPEGALKLVETIDVGGTGYESGTSYIGKSLRDNAINTDYVTVVAGGGGDTKGQLVQDKDGTEQYTVKTEDGLREFTTAFLPGGNVNRNVTITAKADVTVYYYFTVCDGGFAGKTGNVTWTGDLTGSMNNNGEKWDGLTAYVIEFELKAGQSVTIQTDANRVATFAVDVYAISI